MVMVALVWIAGGVSVYYYLGSHRSALAVEAMRPDQGSQGKDGPINHLPGTIFIVQAGTVYRLEHGKFTPVLHSPGGGATWTQPAFAPDGQSLFVVRRDYAYSDIYHVDKAGQVQDQITHNANKTVELNHWAFYPRPSPDGGSLFLSYDPKDRYNDYNVVLAVWQIPMGATFNQNQAKKWSSPEHYTGGDIQPIPLAGGGVLYTKYSFDQATSRILGQIWLTPKLGAVGKALTPATDDCSQPAPSPDGRRLAMICTSAKQFANIVVAPFDGSNLGPRQVLVAGQLAAQPTWAPDGNSLLYVAPTGIGGHFQLWSQQVPELPPPPSLAPTPIPTKPAAPPRGALVARATPTPTPPPSTPTPTATPVPAPVQLTSDLDFDATSTIAWHA